MITGRSAGIVVFSETMLNVAIALDPNHDDETTIDLLNNISELSRTNRMSTILGALYAPTGNDPRLYKAAFLFDRGGNLTGLYRKRELVPFGEHWPLGGLLPRFRRRLISQHGAIELNQGPETQLLVRLWTSAGLIKEEIPYGAATTRVYQIEPSLPSARRTLFATIGNGAVLIAFLHLCVQAGFRVCCGGRRCVRRRLPGGLSRRGG